MQASGGYRRDIDGLRAIAVLSVVLCHLGTPGLAGGYSGVDVFFVISGFLIGGHVSGELAAGRFSLVGFYERRIRRIVPALYALLALVLAAGTLILFGPDFRRLVPVAVSVVGFVANVRIAEALGDYAGARAQASPLLHTWSLAVEEQFYLVFPLAMLAIARLGGRRYAPWLALAAVLSLAASVVAARVERLQDFYLAPFRAWELLLGALVAIGRMAPPRRPSVRGALALAGLALILAADLLVNRGAPWPSEFTLLPCLGAALILHADCGPASLAGVVLTNRAARWIGLWSYSLYLVHWPLLIFTRDWIAAPLSPLARALVLAASLSLAGLSWRFVEQPFRGRRGLFSTPWLFAAAGGAAGLMLGAIFALSHAYGPLHPDEARLFPPPTLAQRVCWELRPGAAGSNPVCVLGAGTTPEAVVWGDSHARALIPAVGPAFAGHDQSAVVFALGGCPPVLGVEVRRRDEDRLLDPLRRALARPRQPCPAHNAEVLAWIAAHRISTVILAGYWIADADPAKAPSAVENRLTLADLAHPDETNEAAIFERDLGATLQALKRLGARVYLAEDAPQQDLDVPIALASAARLGRPPPLGMSRAAYDAQQAVPAAIFERLRRRYGLVLLKPQDILCATGECTISRGGVPFYEDQDHLSPPGAMAARAALDPVWTATP